MRHFTVRLLLLSCFSVCIVQGVGTLAPVAAFADSANILSSFFTKNDASYSGGRGLITFEGISGMFLNPTSGTLGQGQLTLQYCAAILGESNTTQVTHTAMLTYGITDWLEVGVQGRISDFSDPDRTIGAGGPLLRARLLKDESWWPELSVGGLLREGQADLTRRTLFVAASKGMQITNAGFFRSFRLHGGFRQFWESTAEHEGDASIVYIGGEIELLKYLYFVGEVSNKDDAFAHTPFAFGVHLRHPSGFAFTFSGVQRGNQDHIDPYVGIGFNFR
jgi:hypothetical protein